MKEVKKDHILIFPFMAQGHTIPLLHLATFLSTHHHLQITIITTSGNAPFLRQYLPSSINLSIFPFPSSPLLPIGVESTDHLSSMDLHPIFVTTIAHLRPHLHQLLHSLHLSNSLPLCLISDFFLPWTLDVCRLFSVPRLVFHGMSTFSMFICKSIYTHLKPSSFTSSDELYHVPGGPPSLLLSRHQVPDIFLNSGDPNDPTTIILAEHNTSDINSWGIIVNSFSFIEREYTKLFESFFQNGTRAWLIGPLSLLSSPTLTDEGDCLRWLNDKEMNSVVYVAFGTQAHLTAEQLEEVANGLEAAECEYLWVVRDASWRPPERITTGERGKIVRWAPQREVLQHEAVGGFVSHCGWNSVLESMVAGVPVLTWPMIAEQAINEMMIVDEFGAGLRLRKVGADGVVKKEEIKNGVRELMVGEKGKRVRKKMEELGRMAMEAVEDGGSSHKSLSELIEELQRCRNREDDGLELESLHENHQECIKMS
ncbi:scopoletin glucosyltransferase-like [Dioscorea cayenensis subsp. rotundata]|uniref:Glycosyltransferase n=1 Tax=Dioscorea cayennensis subsp. rotundata TaxID=55577 RepID=A0AB40ASA0_DIOCR|nr:scopoletin glucosyltransferase-like [Dioscorea cayenensis subsp. rotundata]